MNLDQLSELLAKLEYRDGDLVWKNPGKRALTGVKAGRIDALGYRHIHVSRCRMVAVHRLIFLMHHGWLPEVVDHIDGNTSNNRIENLRAATRCQNMRNCKTPVTNTSGVKGVYFHKQIGKWTASIRVAKKLTHLGTFMTMLDAACARKSAEIKHYGEFAR